MIATDRLGCVERMNPVAEALTGWPLEEAKGRKLETVFQIIVEKTRAKGESPVSRVLREGHSVGLANHTLLISREGIERPIKDSGAPIRTADGGVAGVVLVFRDATVERAAEVASAYQLQLLQNISEAVIATDAGHRVTTWNPAAERILGFTPGSVLGRPLDEVLVAPGSSGRLMDVLASRQHGGEALRVLRRDGASISVLGRVAALADDEGKVTDYVAVVRDISEQLKMEAQLRLSDRLTSLGTLAAGVAHNQQSPDGGRRKHRLCDGNPWGREAFVPGYRCGRARPAGCPGGRGPGRSHCSRPSDGFPRRRRDGGGGGRGGGAEPLHLDDPE